VSASVLTCVTCITAVSWVLALADQYKEFDISYLNSQLVDIERIRFGGCFISSWHHVLSFFRTCGYNVG